MKSNWQTIWATFCDLAATRGIFEINDAVPDLAARLGVPEAEAGREAAFLLNELSRLPDGRQFFCREGNAVVPLPEFRSLPNSATDRRQAYPFEL